MHPWTLGLALCFEVGAATYAGWWLGNLLDEKYGWAPYGSAGGVVLFLTASLFVLVRVLRNQEKEAADRSREEKKP